MSIQHESFSLVREIAASRANVFAAWARPELKRRWFVDSDGPEWSTKTYSIDFRVGGRETGVFQLSGTGAGASEHRNETVYLDIATDERIVFAYTMALNGRIHSASLVTVALEERPGGTRLTYTEQGAFIGESDGAEGRKRGWAALLGQLEKTLASAVSPIWGSA